MGYSFNPFQGILKLLDGYYSKYIAPFMFQSLPGNSKIVGKEKTKPPPLFNDAFQSLPGNSKIVGKNAIISLTLNLSPVSIPSREF
ncbi:hypothetical protein MHK_005361 [Candidatus Magnetomorum sp. HK-1]|nr:hypothetical protein MHK_005361 [Candidatus Magnetomorum sp. HK-1]